MICFSVGAPTLFSDWCEEVCARLLTRVSGRPEMLPANTLEEVAAAVIRAQGDDVILKVRQPTEALRAALAASGRGFLVVIDDPFAVFSTLVSLYRADSVAAARIAATNCAALVECAAAANAIVLQSNQYADNGIGAARLIARQLGLPLGAADIAAAVADMPPFVRAAERDDASSWSDGIAERCPEFAVGALRGYRDYFAGGGWSEISWSRELFLRGDEPDRAADGVIDLAGEVRALLFGPYIALPPGNWHCQVTLAVSKTVSGMRFSVEVLAGPACILLGVARAAPDHRGVCRVTLSFAIDSRTDQPIALRVINLQPATEGRLALLGVVLNRRTGPTSDIPVELSAALGL